MKFSIVYTGKTERRSLIYRTNEFSFDMTPWENEIDLDITINNLTLSVLNGKIIQVSGFCSIDKKMHANYNVPQSKKGELIILDKLEGGYGAYRISNEDWSVFINAQTGWICIGNPERKDNAVEFINNCVGVVDGNRNFIALWLKPQTSYLKAQEDQYQQQTIKDFNL